MGEATPLVECVPNFSEGRDEAAIDAIAGAIRSVGGVALLDVDPGRATHRTVMTFVGPPEAVLEAAFRGMREAAGRIDMRVHEGAHPRMGATDVCPFVPVRGVTMDDCVALARRLGERVASELGIPVYFYERAAARPERRSLAAVRAGEYEALPRRLGDPEEGPDLGPTVFDDRVARTGATAIGARPFLVAFNVNLNTREVRKAMKIAALIREKGILQRDAEGRILRDAQGRGIRKPGMFRAVRAIGWFIEEYDRCQVSINFTDTEVSPIHEVVDAIRRVADQEGVVVTGSELVGLVPRRCMLEAGRHYLRRQGRNPGAPDAELVEMAIRSLGLRDLGPFDPDQAILENRIESDGPLVQSTQRAFVDRLASSAPAPGGGSVAALCGALSAALAAMVGQLTTGRKGLEHLSGAVEEMAVAAQEAKEGFLADVDADTRAFDGVMAALSLPRRTPEERAARAEALRTATLAAAEVPLRVLERAARTAPLLEVAARGNPNARSDAGVAALTLLACAEAAWYNVRINLQGDEGDTPEGRALLDRARRALGEVERVAGGVRSAVRRELEEGGA